jgi:4-amino-4-deoxy-L-arabinose transferase-like glycosyltransferase
MDEKPAAPASDAWRLASWVCLGIAFAIAAMAVPLVLFGTHVMAKVFVEMKMNLPILTEMSLHPMYVAVFPCLALLGLLKEFLTANKRAALLLNVGLVLLLVFLVIQYATALILPYYTILADLR